MLPAAVFLAGHAPAVRAAALTEAGPWVGALSTTFQVLDSATGDLDGDGREEMVLCYRRSPSGADRHGGVVVLTGRGADARPVFHVQLAGVGCEKARIAGGRVGVLLPGNKQLAWALGKEIRLRSDRASPVAAKTVSASSTLDSFHSAAKAYDNDLTTSWAEGTTGTGIGQTLTIRLERPLDIAAVGLLCGDGNGQRAFLDRNRVHRGSIETKTEADLGDSESGLDFSSLGIATIGDRIEFSCENKPQIIYVPVDKKGVVELSIRIDSVYLGDKKDDTHIAEVELIPLLDPTQTIDRAREVKKKSDDAGGTEVETPGVDVDLEGATKKLDDGGRSIVPDDD
jgi:hypothetical protein